MDDHLPRLGVLAYHSIGTPLIDPWDLSVAPGHFDQQLGVLTSCGHIEALDVALDLSPAARVARRRPVFALTFDDGYVDNLFNALPLLERRDAPATVFIATGLIGQPAFWWDVLADLALASGSSGNELAEAAVKLGLVTGAETAEPHERDWRSVHDQLHTALIQLPPTDIMALLQGLSSEVGIAVPPRDERPVTVDELVQLASHPLVTIGVHSVNHRRLTLLDDEAVRTEIVDAASRLCELLGPGRRVLAYPFGAASAATADVARSAGFIHAVTTDSRPIALRDARLMTPRLHAHDIGRYEFHSWVTSW